MSGEYAKMLTEATCFCKHVLLLVYRERILLRGPRVRTLLKKENYGIIATIDIPLPLPNTLFSPSLRRRLTSLLLSYTISGNSFSYSLEIRPMTFIERRPISA